MKSFLYDVDGTLWDSTDRVAKAWRRVCLSHGIPADHITGARIQREFGKLLADIGRSLFPDLPEDEMLRLVNECCEAENAYIVETAQPLFDGVAETIMELHRRGHRQAIISNCQAGYIEALLKIHPLSAYIDGHLCPGDTGLPKDRNIRIACERFNLPDPVYIGDTDGDYRAAVSAGVPFVFAAYGFGHVEHPDYVIRKPSDLTGLFPL